MVTVSAHDIVTAVTKSTRAVFTTMLGLEIHPGEPRAEPPDAASFDGVVALVGVAGSWTGSGRISCSSRFACRLASALLSTPCDSVNEDVLDALAELSNMIMGNVKTCFEERAGPLALSIPTVVFGRNYQTRFSGVPEWTVVPFECGSETLEIRFCLVPTPVGRAFSQQPGFCPAPTGPSGTRF
jgi:chemotaxis protein CheX